jgi:hypothetical protein
LIWIDLDWCGIPGPTTIEYQANCKELARLQSTFAIAQHEWVNARVEEARASVAVQTLKSEIAKLRHYMHIDTPTLMYVTTLRCIAIYSICDCNASNAQW